MTDPRGNTAATYNSLGNLLTQTDVTGRVVTNGFDISSRLTSVGDTGGNATFAYNADGSTSTATYPNGTRAEYTYNNLGQITLLLHRKVSNNSVIVSYAGVYNSLGQLTQVTEQPSGDITTYSYSVVGNLLSEIRTGARPYSGTYTYDSSGKRLTAVVVTNGVTTHNGTYTYDGAGRLTTVVDTATNITENYVWNSDGTLASSPGPGYTRNFTYDEEGRLLSIARGASIVYQYGYGYDGGRRWRKDILNNVWTWYPCGVACTAGDLVEETSDLTGNVWTASASYLRAGGGCSSQIISRSGETHHIDLLGAAGVITNSSGTIASSNLYDAFSATRFTSGTAATPWRNGDHYQAEEGMIANCFINTNRDLKLSPNNCSIDLPKDLDCLFCWLLPPPYDVICTLVCLAKNHWPKESPCLEACYSAYLACCERAHSRVQYAICGAIHGKCRKDCGEKY